MRELIKMMNDKSKDKRLEALKEYLQGEHLGEYEKPTPRTNDANNHIHTIYSFSPYSPTLAAFMAYRSGLVTMGIMDHDSLSGAKEFIEACTILGVSATVGFEFRTHLKLPDEQNRRFNNPDQNDHSYIAVHGVPHQNIDKLNAFLAGYRDKRNLRNIMMLEKINTKFESLGVFVDFDRDVVPESMMHEGGSITERHLMYALSKKLVEKFGKGERLVQILEKELGLKVSGKAREYLVDVDNELYLYDLLGVLKSDTRFFYIPATAESCDVLELIQVATAAGAIVAYPYLGDIKASVTGDKREQKFEDDILEKLIPYLSTIGIHTIAYMPTRNTVEQLRRLRVLCEKYGFFEISGEDINSPRQKFECAKLKEEEFKNLITSTWALIGHEKMATIGVEYGMFSPSTIANFPNIKERIDYFAEIGRTCD